jgi:hypothetical protein
MRWRVVRWICSPRRLMTDGAFFVAVGAMELQGVSRFGSGWTGMGRVYRAFWV